MPKNFRFPSGPVWKFRTKEFRVELYVTRDRNYQYDGDDEGGETQAKLDSGEYVAFDSVVTVEFRGEEIASDHLGGSVYESDKVPEFWTAHRDSDPMNRNCSIMRAANGENCGICHYFPDMVASAISLARAHMIGEREDLETQLKRFPHIRES